MPTLHDIAYVRDGHRFNMRVKGGALEGGLTCPGKGHCHAWNDEIEKCFLIDWFGDVGWHEFAEYQTRRGDEGWPTAELPTEIEWAVTGADEDSELWWRPLKAPVSNMRQGLNALLAYYPNADVVRIDNQNDTLREIVRSVPTLPFEAEPLKPGAGPWTTVDLVLGGNVLRLAIWNATGHVYRVGQDGAVEDDPFIEVQTT